MNDITSHLIPLLCKSSASKYMIIVRNITNENEKKMIKPISYYHYEVVVYDFTHLKKWNIQSLLKVYVKIHINKSICKGLKKCIFY